MAEKVRFRSGSMHQIRNQYYVLDPKEKNDLELSFYDRVNKRFLKYKEVKKFYKITKIPPFYVLAILITFLGLILINIFNKNLSLSFSTVYPLFMTFKALQYYDEKDSESKEEITHWLKYWVFYSALLNFEAWFSYFLKQFYTFFKIIIILNCFPVKSGILDYFYSIILNFFIKYEKMIVAWTKNVYGHLIDENDNENNQNLGNIITKNINQGSAAIRFIRNII